MIGGKLWFPAPMLWSVGFLATFLFGGITGVMLASPALDFQFQDTAVVAHLHNVLVGGSIFAMWAGITFWFPKVTGRHLPEGLAKGHLAVGRRVHPDVPAAVPAGGVGHAAPYADYPAQPGWAELNLLSTVGQFLIAASMLLFFAAVVVAFGGRPTPGWTRGGQLARWWAASPPPHHWPVAPAGPLGAAGVRRAGRGPAGRDGVGTPPRRVAP